MPVRPSRRPVTAEADREAVECAGAHQRQNFVCSGDRACQAATHEEAAGILNKTLHTPIGWAGSCWKSILMPAAPRLARLSRKAPGRIDVMSHIFAVEEAGVALERPRLIDEFQVERGELHLVLHFFRILSDWPLC